MKIRLKELEHEQEMLLNKMNQNEKGNEETVINKEVSNVHSKTFNLVNNYQYTSDLIQLYNNLNNKYRYDAYESLGFIKEIQNMNEFKLKLLFSVVVVSIRLFCCSKMKILILKLNIAWLNSDFLKCFERSFFYLKR